MTDPLPAITPPRPHRRLPRLLALPVAICLALPAALQPAAAAEPSPRAVGEKAAQYRQAHEAEIMAELVQLLSLPNVARDRDDIQANAELLVTMLERRDFAARILTAGDARPAVYGERLVPGAERTVIFYAHYDGQPVERDRWSSPPWEPTLRDASVDEGGEVIPWGVAAPPFPPEARLYARSASDDKGPIVALLAALDALDDAGIAPSVNLKVFLEGEEEVGSPHLGDMLRTHADLLAADGWLFVDGPMHQSRRQMVVFGVRGVMGAEITVYGPLRSLHSGHYGNWAPNPISTLVDLLGTMRDTEGEILIDGFYEPVRQLSEADRQAIAAVPPVEEQLRESLALGRVEGDGRSLMEAILRPALNFKGLESASVGAEAKNAIPTEAKASIGFRLVPDQTPEGVKQLFLAHLREQGYHVVDGEPDRQTRLAHPKVVRVEWGDGYRAVRTPIDLPISQAVLQVVDAVKGEEAVRVPILGGSLPMYLFEEVLGAPLIIVPMVNHDNNQHAPDENLRIQNLWDGIELYAALLATLDW